MSDPANALSFPGREPMVQAVGEGLHAFANLEFGLSSLFTVMLDSDTGFTILDAARHFEVRMRIIERVAPLCLNDADLATARNHFNRARKRGDTRNKLAHWQVGLWPPAASAEEAANMKWALLPPASGTRLLDLLRNPKSEGDQPLSKTQVLDFAMRCHAQAQELLRFSQQVIPAKRSS